LVEQSYIFTKIKPKRTKQLKKFQHGDLHNGTNKQHDTVRLF